MDIIFFLKILRIEKELLDRLESVLNKDGTPTVDDIQNLKFTEKVLRESMRLYPPVWLLGLNVDNNYTLGKYTVPAGSTIMMSQYLTHHDPHYYNEPDRFDPERCSQGARSSLPRISYFPFGGGIRVGEAFAWMEGIQQAMENDPRPRSSCRTGPGHHFTVKVRYENETTTKECAKIMKFSIGDVFNFSQCQSARSNWPARLQGRVTTKIVMSKAQLNFR